MMIGAVLMSTLVTSCHDHRPKENITVETLDSLEKEAFIMDVMYQCKATDVDNFMAKMDRMKQSYEDDQILCSLSPLTIRSIANVVLERYGMFDKHDVVEEYLYNKKLYDSVDKTNKQLPNVDKCSICEEQEPDSSQKVDVPKETNRQTRRVVHCDKHKHQHEQERRIE